MLERLIRRSVINLNLLESQICLNFRGEYFLSVSASLIDFRLNFMMTTMIYCKLFYPFHWFLLILRRIEYVYQRDKTYQIADINRIPKTFLFDVLQHQFTAHFPIDENQLFCVFV